MALGGNGPPNGLGGEASARQNFDKAACPSSLVVHPSPPNPPSLPDEGPPPPCIARATTTTATSSACFTLSHRPPGRFDQSRPPTPLTHPCEGLFCPVPPLNSTDGAGFTAKSTGCRTSGACGEPCVLLPCSELPPSPALVLLTWCLGLSEREAGGRARARTCDQNGGGVIVFEAAFAGRARGAGERGVRSAHSSRRGCPRVTVSLGEVEGEGGLESRAAGSGPTGGGAGESIVPVATSYKRGGHEGR